MARLIVFAWIAGSVYVGLVAASVVAEFTGDQDVGAFAWIVTSGGLLAWGMHLSSKDD